MTQQSLFYDSPYDAIEKAIIVSGKSKKEIACILYPGRQIETAKSLLSRALCPDNTDVRLSIESLLSLMQETRPHDIIYFLCDEFGFERPEKKQDSTPEKELELLRNKIRAHGLEKIFDL
jgi:hypothetical protein